MGSSLNGSVVKKTNTVNTEITATKTERRKPKQQRALEKYQAVLDASAVVLMRDGCAEAK